MQIEIKIVLEGFNDYQTLVDSLAPLYITEESYCDFFYDFDIYALTSENSVLRLRVPCENPCSAPPPTGPYNEEHNPNPSGHEDTMAAAFRNFLHSCDTPQPSVGAHGNGVHLIPNETGKLVFKQKNTVEQGHQLNFVVEQKKVPSEVVNALVSGEESPYSVLTRYAEQLSRIDTEECNKVEQIIEKIRYIAAAYCTTPPPETSEQNEGYSQIRYASGSLSQEREATRTKDVDTLCSRFQCIGHYATTRKVFQYFPSSAVKSAEERKLLEGLRIRVDRTLFPSSEIYELEIPQCDIPADEVMEDLKEVLKGLHISYQLGSEGKYSRYIREIRGENAKAEDVTDVKLRLVNIEGYNEVRRNFEQIVSQQRAAQESRRITNLDYPSDTVGNSDSGELFQEEFQENYFFDGPNLELQNSHCFLRLRRAGRPSRYTLVFKENQTVVEGQQENQSIKMELSDSLATQLLEDPTGFLHSQYKSNSIAKVLFYQFNLSSLQRCAYFTNYRISVPWWSATSQQTSVRQTAPLGTTQQQFEVSSSYLLSQQHASGETAFMPPLIIHLDRTLYEVGPSTQPRQPFTGVPVATRVDLDTGRRTFEFYEMEVTNIAAETPAAAVLRELAGVLNGLGVEFTKASRSKLDQYYILANS